jgi:uncharacterized protein
MVWKHLALGAAALLTLAACDKKPTESDVRVTPAPSAAVGPALWKTGDGDTTLYLFGTVHVLPPSVDWRKPAVDEALAAAKAVYFETDIDPNPGQIQAFVAEYGSYTPPEKLSDHLTPAEQAALTKASGDLSVPMFVLDTMKPWLAALALSEEIIKNAGYDPNSGVERKLLPDAVAAGKEIRKLETVEAQLMTFADLPEDIQVKYLMQGVNEIGKESEMLSELVHAWATGDVASINSLMIEGDMADLPEVNAALLVGRNRNWTEILDKLVKDEPGTFFVAVGAGHLAGKDSVIAMMTAKGYTFERVE